MARNCEKKLATLNRYVLAKEKDGKSANGVSFKKSRPPLKSLKTADDLKKWMPSITKVGLTMKKMIITEFVQIFIVDVALLDVANDVICLLIRHSWVELFTENH